MNQSPAALEGKLIALVYETWQGWERLAEQITELVEALAVTTDGLKAINGGIWSPVLSVPHPQDVLATMQTLLQRQLREDEESIRQALKTFQDFASDFEQRLGPFIHINVVVGSGMAHKPGASMFTYSQLVDAAWRLQLALRCQCRLHAEEPSLSAIDPLLFRSELDDVFVRDVILESRRCSSMQ